MKKTVVMLSTYNGEKYLNEQLDSIFSQDTDSHIKLLVRDDGSKDSTVELLEKWKKRGDIEIIKDGRSLGAAHSFWKLIEKAEEADYYAFVDQDDVWDSNKISTAISEIGRSNKAVLWFSNCRLIDETGKTIKNRLKEENQTPKLAIESELICGSAQGCAMVFNYAALNTVRNYKIKTIPMHDIVLMEYIIALGKVLYHDEPLFSYRVHRNNVVAKQGKPALVKLKSSYNQWFVKNKHMYQMMSKELLENIGGSINDSTKDYLQRIVDSRKSLRTRLSILRDSKTYHYDKSTLRSFKIRVILGII